MKPVFQTRYGTPKGNCMEACVASILGLELTDVPDLYSVWVDGDTNEENETRRSALLRSWLLSIGAGLTSFDRDALVECKVRLPIGTYLIGGGKPHAADLATLDEPPHEGAGHACVYRLEPHEEGMAAYLVHDPHEGWGGLEQVDEFVLVHPLDMATFAQGAVARAATDRKALGAGGWKTYPPEALGIEPPPGCTLVHRSDVALVYNCWRPGGVTHLIVQRLDGKPATWAQLQYMKDSLGYSKNEAIELYPACDEVVEDMARHLWVLSEADRFSHGLDARRRDGAAAAMAGLAETRVHTPSNREGT